MEFVKIYYSDYACKVKIIEKQAKVVRMQKQIKNKGE